MVIRATKAGAVGLDLGQYAVQRGLVQEPGEHGPVGKVLIGRERRDRRATGVDLIAPCRSDASIRRPARPSAGRRTAIEARQPRCGCGC